MVEKLGSVVGAVAEPLIGDKIKNKTAEIIDTKFTDPRLITNIEEMLLNSFGNEPYYNNLTKFLEQFHTIKNVLDMFNGENAIESKEKFVTNNVNLFVKNYGCQANEISELNKVFSSVYEQAYNVKIVLNPHSDLGKLQLDNHRFEDKLDSKSDMMIDMLKTIISNQSASKMGNIAILNTDDIEASSEKVEKFLEKIKDVGKENNPTENDEDAIAKYTKLLADCR